MPTMAEQAMDSGSGDSYYYTSDTSHVYPTPTSTPSTVEPTPEDDIIHFSDTPEYELGGGLIALFAGFIAFTLFIRKNKTAKVA
jgi:hypothetical protein